MSLVSEFMHQLKEAHLQVALRIVKKGLHEVGFYLNETRV